MFGGLSYTFCQGILASSKIGICQDLIISTSATYQSNQSVNQSKAQTLYYTVLVDVLRFEERINNGILRSGTVQRYNTKVCTKLPLF